MSYNPLHLYEEDVAEQVMDVLKTASSIDNLKEAFARAIDRHVEEIVAEHINSLEIITNCMNEGSVFISYMERSELADNANFLCKSISLQELLDDLDPGACDSREDQERIAAMLERAAKKFRDDDFFTNNPF